MRKNLLFLFALWCVSIANAQRPINVGSGSYAEYTPLYKSRTAERPGDQSYLMENRKLYITDRNIGRAIPTNDWWTDLLVSQYSGNLWAYPQVVKAENYGFFVAYPKEWESTGHELKWKTHIEVSGVGFKPVDARADNWHDWGLDFLMKDNNTEMLVTLAHGIPFTWVQSKNLVLQLNIAGGQLSDASGQPLSLPFTGSKLMVEIQGDVYGIFAPAGTQFSSKNGLVQVEFQGADQFLSIGVLPSKQDFNTYAQYAYTRPVNSTVGWDYNEETGKVLTTWALQTENLAHQPELNVLQGFIPHHYKNTVNNLAFNGLQYQTPRGKMKMATGRNFTIEYKFNGMLPFFANPLPDETLKNPYQRNRMKQMIADYADKGNFGGDTYWGGKGLIQMAMYMTFAHQMGETQLFEKCKSRLKDVLINWLTYTPGENSYFFAKYPRWKALVGYDTSYDSDTFNDHHFHYGYFTMASGILALFDDDFKRNYGDMATLLAKEYANWDRNDQDFPMFRTLDPWAGHSYAGGLGSWNGNGQESTSEAMQGWGGVYMLGVATGNKTMRDAGIFGWTLEARGTAEYWFDRDKENIDYTKYTPPYNSNLTSQGIGWWTWFSGDPVWMHSIQWLPMTPALKYLYEDLNFAAWDYKQMWDRKEIRGWETTLNLQPSALSYESGIGNVVLSYLQVFNPDSAAAVFDKLWDANMPMVRNHDTGGMSYFMTHSHRTYGDIDWTTHANLPTATTYIHPVTGKYTYMVYNPEATQRKVKFYRGGAQVLEINAPANKLTVYSDSPQATSIQLTVQNGNTVAPGTTATIVAQVLDQYGATITPANFTWSASGQGSVNNSGVFTASNSKGTAAITASASGLTGTINVRIDDLPVLTNASLLPQNQRYVEKGKSVNFSVNAKDQYGEAFQGPVQWQIIKGANVVKTDSVFNVTDIGEYTVKAIVGGQTITQQVYLAPKFRNIALGKNAYSSSEENVGTITSYATDGRYDTRWGSQHSDPQWIYVDLAQSSYIGYVSLIWEAAYSSLYEIQISDDAQTWETIKTVNGLGKTEFVEVNRTARYVRMLGLSRATPYGHSLYEFEVYGVPPMGNSPVLFGIDVTPGFAQMKEGETVALAAKGYDQFGSEMVISPTFTVKAGEGTVTTNGAFTPSKYGKAVVEVKVNDLQATAEFFVEETIKLKQILVSPKNTQLIKGESLIFSAQAKDQFGVDFPSTGISYQVIAGQNANLNGNVFSSNQPGTYKVAAGSGSVKDTAVVVVSDITAVNLALHKPTFSSSNENDATLGKYVNDGQLNTRWGSTFKDGEYIQIDLEENYVINKIKLFWDPAYASSYRILVSTDEDNWTVAHEQFAGTGGTETINLSQAMSARYIRLVGLTRSTAFGVSINEFEVYGTHIWRNPVASTITASPNPLVVYLGESKVVTAKLLDQYQLPFIPTQAYQWQVTGGGTVNQQGQFTPSALGNYQLTVSYGGLSEHIPLEVKAQRVLTKLLLTPANRLLKTGEKQQYQAKGLDQFDNDFAIGQVTWTANGGQIDTQGEFEATQNGSFTITATSAGVSGQTGVEVFTRDNQNLALNKPANSSTGMASASYAVDGNAGSRWESAHNSQSEWLMIDLQAIYNVTDIEVLWETASARDYEIQVSTDGQQWTTVYNVVNQQAAGTRLDALRTHATGRYLRLVGTRAQTPWGFSIFEFRAFGRFVEAITLPVNYISFEAKQSQQKVQLLWKTAAEKDNQLFEVERSINGKDFTSIGTIDGNGNSNAISTYQWTDKSPLAGVNYYRLKQKDNNGDFAYSDPKSVNYAFVEPISIYPNPIARAFQVKGLSGSKHVFKLFNTLGQQVYSGVIANNQSQIAQVSAGIYMIQIIDASGNTVYRDKISVKP